MRKFYAELVIAAEAELKLMAPYKTAEFGVDETKLLTAPGYKIDAVDIWSDGVKATAYWTDHQNKRIQSMAVNNNRTERSLMTVPKTILSNLQDPRGISLDWIAKRIYVTDGNRILASTLNGSLVYTLITGKLNQPRDIVVVSSKGVMFWCDWGPAPRIETADMDGYKRKTLVSERILWPTGLAVDYATNRLYWADPKAMTIETVLFDGTKRHIVKHFDNGEYTVLNLNKNYIK